MKNECNIVIDLLPLYAEDMVSEETKRFIEDHLSSCDGCRRQLGIITGADIVKVAEPEKKPESEGAFKRIMKRMNRQFYSLSYSLIIFFVFLGFGWTAGENLMYNSLIMPIVGVFAYLIFGWRAVYKMPVLLLVIDMFVCLTKLINIGIYAAFLWTIVYSLFVLVGIAIAFLLHYAFKKENN